MKHSIFGSMKEQLNPSLQAQSDLKETLSRPAKAKSVRWQKYVAVAACAALVIAAGSVTYALRGTANQPRQHSYTTLDQPYRPMVEQKHPLDVGGTESATQTGSDLLGGATVGGGDVSVQDGALLYDRLMEGMGMLNEDAQYPDWYGGAYIDADGGLTVLLVDSENPGDKSLELQVLEWTGSARVSFTSAKYSLAHLTDLMKELDTLLDGTGVFSTHAVYEVENRIDLDLPAPADDKLLAELAKLDPDDDAIQVRVYSGVEDAPHQKGPQELPTKVKLGEDPVPDSEDGPVPGGDTPVEMPRGDMDGDPAGYTKLPAVVHTVPQETEEPARYDLLPLETPSIANEDDALAIEPTLTPGEDISSQPAKKVSPAQSMETPAFSPSGE